MVLVVTINSKSASMASTEHTYCSQIFNKKSTRNPKFIVPWFSKQLWQK